MRHDTLAALETIGDLDLTLAAFADGDFPTRDAGGLAGFDQPDGLAFPIGHQRALRNRQRLAGGLVQLHFHQHARQQAPVGIVQIGAHHQASGDGVDSGAEGGDLCTERGVGIARCRGAEREPRMQHREQRCRYGEIELHGIELVQRDQLGAGGHQRTDADVAQPDGACKGRA